MSVMSLILIRLFTQFYMCASTQPKWANLFDKIIEGLDEKLHFEKSSVN